VVGELVQHFLVLDLRRSREASAGALADEEVDRVPVVVHCAHLACISHRFRKSQRYH
jgi:hypothetical protein